MATPRSVVDALAHAVDQWPDRTFLDFNGRAFRFDETWSLVSSLASRLRGRGVGPGDRVVTMLDNNEDCVASWFASNLLGAIWVPINTALRATFLDHVVRDAGAKVVICERDFVERFRQLPELHGVSRLLVRGADEDVAALDTVAVEVLERDPAPMSNEWASPALGDVSLLVYTGGTTGPSKGCVISHGYVLNLCRRYIECTKRRGDEVNWSPLPAFHFNLLGQTIMSSIVLGGTASIAGRFSLSGFWPEIERSGARIVNLLGAMGALIADMPDTDEAANCFGQVRFVHGSPFPPDVEHKWRTRFGVPHVGSRVFGLTEAVPLTTLECDEPSPPGSCGKVNDTDFEVRVVDDEDREVDADVVGEIIARPNRPDVMFKGYWNRPSETLQAMGNLWFHTGDLGRFDCDGHLFFVDRKKDYLRRRGENISSVELEQAFAAHPDIAEVAAHAVESALTEDDVKVTAVLRPGATLTPADLFEWAKDRVPYFALPRFIEFRDHLPISPLGRVHKFQLRAEGCTSNTWDREQADVTWERR